MCQSSLRGLVVVAFVTLAIAAGFAPPARALPSEAPASLRVVEATTTSVKVAWDAPSTAYADVWVTFAGPYSLDPLYGGVGFGGGSFAGPVTEYARGELVCGSTYTITVAFSDGPASEVNGDPASTAGPASSITPTTASCTKPAPPQLTGLEASYVDANSAFFEWDAPADPNVKSVSVLLGGPGRNSGGTYGTDTLSFDSWFGGRALVCEETYTFSIIAVNDEGLPSPVAATTVTTASCDELGPPSPAPTGLQLTASTRSSLTFAWDPPPDASSVWLTRTAVDPPVPNTTPRYSRGAITTIRKSSLACGTTYTFSVQWVGLDGSRSEPALIPVTTSACPPPPTAPPAEPPSGPSGPPVVVIPPDRTPPAITIRARNLVVSSKRVVTLQLNSRFDPLCRGDLRLVPTKRKVAGTRLPGSFGKAKFAIRAAPAKVKVVVPKPAFAALRKLRVVTVLAKVRSWDPAGNSATVSLRLKLIAPKHR